ncbi:glycoside hydrolase family 172 protein [Bifidobacterium sp. ESL0764]|uniref:glycoside hydrolase family 172 protein n=2 Tax=unclassified Bifidobacterium TaxID=2608897 RepID=UPI0023F9DAD0|nr:glycoside hydrolase family 172 protein [Bifidobacterium sp. ESL0764]WEV65715.1 DUF2961 domain-containing protein [Bifidobacterium sp. ESL0764]
MESLTRTMPFVSRSITAENPDGAKGKGGRASSELGPSRKGAPCLKNIASGASVNLADISGPGCITHLWFTVNSKTDSAHHFVLRDLLLRFYWDDEATPSVECPLGDFFCNGFGATCAFSSFPVVVAPNRGLNCYWRMPFARHARIELVNQHENPIPDFFYQVDYVLYDDPLPADTVYFHAQWRRQAITEKQSDYVILDNVNGSGHYVGTYLALASLERGWWGEGEMKFYIDDDGEYPTICGTGTEDYFGGAWSFMDQDRKETFERNYTAPFIGYPYYSRHDPLEPSLYHNDDMNPERGMYRWHIPDPIVFRKNLRVTLQQIGSREGGNFERQDDISSVAYWYQCEPHTVFPPMVSADERRPR